MDRADFVWWLRGGGDAEPPADLEWLLLWCFRRLSAAQRLAAVAVLAKVVGGEDSD